MTRQPPDPALMAEAREILRQANALRARGLDEEGQAMQEESTRVWMRALGRPDAVREPTR
jgi:hypothetical protein